jgi:hypothetical protein
MVRQPVGVSALGHVDITQFVDGSVGVHAICPKNIFVKQ